MANKKPHTDAQKATRFDGEKSNRNTKGNSAVRINKSKLRQLADKLRQREDLALELIDKSLNNQQVNPDSVASAKWVIQSLVSVEKAANADEISNFKARLEGKRDPEEQTPEEIKSELKPRLSLVYVDPDEENEE